MSLDTEDRKEIMRIVERKIDAALDYVEDDQKSQDTWIHIQIAKIYRAIHTLQDDVRALQGDVKALRTNGKWHTGLLIAIFVSILVFGFATMTTR